MQVQGGRELREPALGRPRKLCALLCAAWVWAPSILHGRWG